MHEPIDEPIEFDAARGLAQQPIAATEFVGQHVENSPCIRHGVHGTRSHAPAEGRLSDRQRAFANRDEHVDCGTDHLGTDLAVELVAQNKTGQMVCLQDGVFSHAALPDAARGARTVDVETSYDTERFRPKFSSRLGKPIFS